MLVYIVALIIGVGMAALGGYANAPGIVFPSFVLAVFAGMGIAQERHYARYDSPPPPRPDRHYRPRLGHVAPVHDSSIWTGRKP